MQYDQTIHYSIKRYVIRQIEMILAKSRNKLLTHVIFLNKNVCNI